MAKTKIPEDIQEQVNNIISRFNKMTFGPKSGIEYIAEFKGDFLYLNRIEKYKPGPIARLKFAGKMNNWKFVIYKYITCSYDPDEHFFWGAEHVDGTIEGALKAAQAAYPVDYTPPLGNFPEFLKKLKKFKL